MRRLAFIGMSVGILSFAGVGVATSAQDRVTASQPAADLDERTDQILSRLEQRRINDLRAKVKWELRYAMDPDEDAERKFGELWYKKEEPVAKFKVRFERKQVGSRMDRLEEEHLFDGAWYTELKSEPSKTIQRRQVRRPNDPSDPYKLGEGAFPLPFGQKKSDILRDFEVSVLPLGKNDPPNTDRLMLTPKPGTRTGELYGSVEFWIAREGPESGLPIMVRAAKLDGTGQVNSTITITFQNPELDVGVASSVFVIDDRPGYEVINEPLPPEGP